jgi:predicted nucleotidyltransferase
MHPLIERNRPQIAKLCQRYGVRRLEVFGSLLRDDFDTVSSDVDLTVEFEPAIPGQGLQQYFGFKHELEHLFARPVDLLELTAMENTRLKRLIERTRIAVYAAPC